jgi:murein DD-endopeptidase MepM/ murein hydrolase activator NlpD
MKGKLLKKRIRYIYNAETDEYIQQPFSYKGLLMQILGHSAAGILSGLLFFTIFVFTFDSPNEQTLRKENRQLHAQYDLLQRKLVNMQSVLSDIKDRDNNMYRAILHTDTIPSEVRRGTFNPERYESLMRLTNSEFAIEVTKKVDAIAKQIYVQSRSFDELASLATQKEQMLRCIPAIQPVLNKDLKLITSGFGVRIDPVYKTPKFHSGMDFNAPRGVDVYATGDGVVVEASWDQGYGNCIVIDHGFGYQTLYAHLDSYSTRRGAKVKRGDIIGKVGASGKATGYHLHYEVHYKGTPINPQNFFYMDLSPKDYDRMVQMSNKTGVTFD